MTLPEQVPALLDQLKPYVAQIEEVQLLDFSVRAGYGPYAKFRYRDPECLTGYQVGQRFTMILIALEDDEMPAASDPQRRKPYRLSQLAGMMCNEPEFRAWIAETYGEPCPDVESAAQFIREACGIDSRSLLDANPVAAETFKTMLAEFDAYKRAA